MNTQNQKTILAMDDNAEVLMCLRDFFESHQYRVLTAQDRYAALELLKVQNDKVILISDLQGIHDSLTGKILFETAVREEFPIKLAIMISGSFDDGDSQMRFPELKNQFGAKGIPYLEVAKPFFSGELKKIIESKLCEVFAVQYCGL